MAPNVTSAPAPPIYQNDINEAHTEEAKPKSQYKREIVWRNVIIFIFIHLGAVWGLHRVFTVVDIKTTVLGYILYVCSGLGITAGAHRLWSHRAYKAKFPLRVLLMIFNTIAFQNSIYEWSRDHRVHHKYSETHADPHNAKRGFFFAHCGWLLCKKHPDVREKGKCITMNDLRNDPVVDFQDRHYGILMPLFAIILPSFIAPYFWGETFLNSFLVAVVLRWVVTVNATWLVNSAAHLFGGKPYDRFINPAENIGVAIGALGEGWHNYHHVFPWDYKAAELGNYRFNFTTGFIDFFAKIGLAYDLKRVSVEIIEKRVQRTGDGSHEVWGWGDADQPLDERKAAIIDYECNGQDATDGY